MRPEAPTFGVSPISPPAQWVPWAGFSTGAELTNWRSRPARPAGRPCRKCPRGTAPRRRRRPGGDVDPVQRHRLDQLGVLLLAGFDHAVDVLERPAVHALQQPGDQLAHILHPHAARRMEAEIVAEQILQRRVVHVHAEGARKIDADRAERIEAAGILLERVMGRVFRIPVDLRRLQLALACRRRCGCDCW